MKQYIMQNIDKCKLEHFLNSFTNAEITKNDPHLLQYVKDGCSQSDINGLLCQYKAVRCGNDKEGIYVTVFTIENCLGYKKIIITFQEGVYKANRHLNCTIVNLVKYEKV